jgi:hypothetical protein
MACKEFYVVLHRNEWKIRYEDRHFGPFNTQEEAISKAIDLAHGMGAAGGAARVLIQDKRHVWRIEWTHGDDPYPPKVENGRFA